MPFQFSCPRGHLLEADESQAGQQCQCPMCGEMFPIPAPSPAVALGAAPSLSASPPLTDFAFAPGGAASGFGQAPAASERLLHIPCPQGHELEVPPEMLGQDVLCPHCQTQFRLRDKDSVEFKRKKQQELELKDYKTGQLWFTWAIIIVVLVVLGLIIMIAVGAGE